MLPDELSRTVMKPSQVKLTLELFREHKASALIVAPPGVGKTDIGAQAYGYDSGSDDFSVISPIGYRLKISHPIVEDPTNAKGLGWVSEKVSLTKIFAAMSILLSENPKASLSEALAGLATRLPMDSILAEDVEARFIPYGDLKEMMHVNVPTGWLLDDLGQANPSVQAAYMQLLLSRQIDGKRISDLVTFIACSNRREDKAGVGGILEPVKSRFVTIINMVPDHEDWYKWANTHNMPADLIAFIRFRNTRQENFLHNFKATNDLTNSICPRTVANVGKIRNMNPPSSLEYQLYAGAAGETFAAEYINFKNMIHKLPNMNQIETDPNNAIVPEKKDISTLYAVCGALAVRATKQNIRNLYTYLKRLDPVWTNLAMQDAGLRNPELMETTTYTNYTIEFDETKNYSA